MALQKKVEKRAIQPKKNVQAQDKDEWKYYREELQRTRPQTQTKKAGQSPLATQEEAAQRLAQRQSDTRSTAAKKTGQSTLTTQKQATQQATQRRSNTRSAAPKKTGRSPMLDQKEATQNLLQRMNTPKRQQGYTDKERQKALETLRELKAQERDGEGSAQNQVAQANEKKILGLETITPEKERELIDFYNKNSEKAKRAEWEKTADETKNAYKTLRNWEMEEQQIAPVEAAYAALDAGKALTEEQRMLIRSTEESAKAEGRTGRERVAAARSEIDAGKQNEQAIIDSREDAYKRGYQSIMDERIAWRQGKVSELEKDAAWMIDTGNEGKWIQNWMSEYKDASAEVAQVEKDVLALEASGQADEDVLTEAKERLGQLKKQQALLKDTSILTKADFASKSRVNDANRIADPIYNIVNRGSGGDGDFLDMTLAAPDSGLDKYYGLTETEKGIYNYYYNTEGREAAKQYLDRIDDRLLYRKASKDEAEWEATAKEHPVISTVGSVIASPLEMEGVAATAWAGLTGREISPYSDAFQATRFKNTTRGTVRNQISAPVGQFAYDVGTSMADMGMASVMGGGSSAMSSAFMSASAGASTAYDTLLRGGCSRDAAFAGGTAAITEALTEKLPFDRMVKNFQLGQGGGSYKELLSTFIKGFIPEGLEEVPGNFVEEAVDGYLMGKNSNRNQAINAYMDQGMRMDEAINQADWDFARETAMSFLAGGTAGGMMQMGAYGVGKLSARQTAKSIRESVPAVSETDAQAMGEMAAGLRPQDDAVVERVTAQIQEAAYKEERNPFHAKAAMDGQQVEVTGIERTGDAAKVTIRQDGAEKAVALGDVQFGSADALTAYEYATVYDDLTTARQFLAGYEASTLPIKTYRAAFEAAYQAGESGVQVKGANATYAGMLSPEVWNLAYKAGQQAAQAQETRLEMDADVQRSIRKTIEALPRYDMIEDGYTGAALRLTNTKLTSAQATQIALLDQVGKKYGTVYTVVDSLDSEGAAVQGMYEPGSNRVVIALNAEEGNLLRVAGHESWHYIRENSQSNEVVKAQAEALQEFVMDKLQATEGYDLEERIAEKTEQYKNAVGQELTREEAMEELMADSLVDVLSTEENVRELMENHATLGEKIMGFIKRFLNEVRGMLQRIGKTNPEARAMLMQDEATLQTVSENFDRVMVTVNALREAQGAGITVTGEGEAARFSIKDSAGHEVIMTQEEFEENKQIVAGMKPIAAASGNKFPGVQGSEYRKAVQEYFSQTGNIFHHPIFGEIRIMTSGIKHLTRYKSYVKSALVPLVKTVVENGVLVDIDAQHKQSGRATAVIAAPVMLDGREYYMGVAIMQENSRDNRYYIHEAALVQQNKEDDHPATETEPIKAEPSPDNHPLSQADYLTQKPGAEAYPGSDNHPDIYTILNSISKYNGENGKKKMKEAIPTLEPGQYHVLGTLHRDGFIHTIHEANTSVKEKEVGQISSNQFRRWFGKSKVVNEDGSPKVMYHGTATEFWAFDKRKATDTMGRRIGLGAGKGKFYLTEHRESAQAAANSAASTGRGKTPKIMELYVSAQNVMDRAVYERRLREVFQKYPGSTPFSPDYDYKQRDKAITELDRQIRKEGYDGVWDHDSGEMFVFEPTQIKSATDNIGLFDPDTPDIRYSLRDVDADNGDMARLLEENQELRDTVRRLKSIMKAEGVQIKEVDTRSIARKLKKEYSSKVPQAVLEENLGKAFSAMLEAETTGQSEAAMKIMSDIALDMLQKSEMADNTAWQESKELRDRFRKESIGLTDTQWQEAKSIFGSARDFRRAMMGKWMMPGESKQGVTTLDMIWPEISEQYPQYFDANASEGDMVSQVLDMLDTTAVKYTNPFGAEVDQMASGVAMEIYELLMGEKQSEKQQNGSVAAVAELNKATEELKRAREMIISQKRDLQAAGRYKARTEAQRARRQENEAKQKARNSIIRNRDRIAKKLERPKADAFVPFQLSEAVEGLMDALDFTMDGKKTISREMLERAKAAYMNAPKEAETRNGMNDGPLSAFYNGDLEETFNELIEKSAGKTARELTLEELNNLKEVVGGYAAMIVNEDRLFTQEKRDGLRETGGRLMTELYTRREHTVQGGLTQWLQNGVSRGLLKPVTVFEELKGTAMEPIWKALRKAEGTHIRNVNSAAEYLEKALDTYHQHESINREGKAGKRKDNAMSKEIKLQSGETIRLTDQELMTLYATYKREKLVHTNHLLGGGFTLENAPKRSSLSPIRVTAGDLNAMGELLTQEQKDYVEHMVKYLSTTCSEWGNEVTRELYGIEKFGEGYYIPFSVVRNSVAEDPAEPQDARIKVGSFTKSLTREASNALVIKPFTQLWCEHVEKMSDYNAFVLPIEDMTRLMNYKQDGESMRMVMNQRLGRQATDYIMSFLRRLNGNGRAEMGSSWINTMMSHAKGAAVTFNLSVAIQQMGAGARAMAEISPKYFLPASISLPGQKKGWRFQKSYDEMAKYTPIGVEKGWGYFDTNMSRGLYQRAQSDLKSTVNDWGGKLAEMGDQFNWGQIWEAVKRETLDTHSHLEEGSKAYFEACADRFTEVIDKTQVVDSIFQRCEWATEKGMMKNMMAFMSEPVTMYNMIYRQGWALRNTKRGTAAYKAAWKKAARNVTAILVSSAMTAALKSVVSALRDRDNEKKEKDEDGKTVIVGVRGYKDKYLDSLWPNMVDNMLGVGTVFTNMITDAMSGFTGGGDLSTAWLGNFYAGFKELSKGEDADWEKGLYKLNQGASALLGIGFSNLHRDVKSVYLTTVETIGRDSLAGAAWDESLSMDKRLEAAKKNYVYAKQPGEKRKQNTGIYYDLMLTSYFENGFGEDFQKAADAAIETGAIQKGLESGFKTRLRAAESRIPEAAKALMESDIDTYAQLVKELEESGIGLKAINSMINSEISAMTPKEEEEPGSGEGLAAALATDEVKASDTAERKVSAAAYNEAVEAGNAKELKAAVEALRNSGLNDKELRQRVSSTYKKSYQEAVWSGDDKEAQRISAMLKGCGLDYDNADLYAWVVDDGYTTIKKAIEEGDSKRAIQIRKVIYDRVGQKEADKKIETRIKNSAKDMDAKEKEALKEVLIQLGYSKATIEKLVK